MLVSGSLRLHFIVNKWAQELDKIHEGVFLNNSILIRHIEVISKLVLLIKPVVTKQIELKIYHKTLLTIIELRGFGVLGFWGFDLDLYVYLVSLGVQTIVMPERANCVL